MDSDGKYWTEWEKLDSEEKYWTEKENIGQRGAVVDRERKHRIEK